VAHRRDATGVEEERGRHETARGARVWIGWKRLGELGGKLVDAPSSRVWRSREQCRGRAEQQVSLLTPFLGGEGSEDLPDGPGADVVRESMRVLEEAAEEGGVEHVNLS
jgi:hypothetical protein